MMIIHSEISSNHYTGEQEIKRSLAQQRDNILRDIRRKNESVIEDALSQVPYHQRSEARRIVEQQANRYLREVCIH